MDKKIRLQLYLARCGIASRRRCEEIIKQGKVKVNGVVIKEPYLKIDPDSDKVEYLDTIVNPPSYLFYKMYKPVGYLTTMRDERGRKTIADLIPSELGRVFPVGRLDLDSEGLVILTNHGEAANRMLHPRYHFQKEYQVKLDRVPNIKHLKEMSSGVILDGKKTMPAAYELSQPNSRVVRVIIMEGRKRQIKHVFGLYGYKVMKLKRVEMGPIKLGNMKIGEARRFTMKEILDLLNSLGLGNL